MYKFKKLLEWDTLDQTSFENKTVAIVSFMCNTYI